MVNIHVLQPAHTSAAMKTYNIHWAFWMILRDYLNDHRFPSLTVLHQVIVTVRPSEGC